MRSDLRVATRPMAAVLLLLSAMVLTMVLGFGAVIGAAGASVQDVSSPGSTTGPMTGSTTRPGLSGDGDTTTHSTNSSPEPSDAGSSDPDPDPEPSSSPSAEPTTPVPGTTGPTPTTPLPSSTVRTIDNATFRWGINNQSNARSHERISYNFFSAGVAIARGFVAVRVLICVIFPRGFFGSWWSCSFATDKFWRGCLMLMLAPHTFQEGWIFAELPRLPRGPRRHRPIRRPSPPGWPRGWEEVGTG